MPNHDGWRNGFGDSLSGGAHGALPLWAALALTLARMLPLLAVFAIVALARLRQARGPRLRAAPARMAIEAPAPSALEVLRERYALGEIDLFTFADTVELVLAAEVEGYSTATQYA
jgi:uncharacterized membrane protein